MWAIKPVGETGGLACAFSALGCGPAKRALGTWGKQPPGHGRPVPGAQSTRQGKGYEQHVEGALNPCAERQRAGERRGGAQSWTLVVL